MENTATKLWGIDVVLGSVRALVDAHGPACVCTLCHALSRAEVEYAALETLVLIAPRAARRVFAEEL